VTKTRRKAGFFSATHPPKGGFFQVRTRRKGGFFQVRTRRKALSMDMAPAERAVRFYSR
jgi:hypothetical protein